MGTSVIVSTITIKLKKNSIKTVNKIILKRILNSNGRVTLRCGETLSSPSALGENTQARTHLEEYRRLG